MLPGFSIRKLPLDFDTAAAAAVQSLGWTWVIISVNPYENGHAQHPNSDSERPCHHQDLFWASTAAEECLSARNPCIDKDEI